MALHTERQSIMVDHIIMLEKIGMAFPTGLPSGTRKYIVLTGRKRGNIRDDCCVHSTLCFVRFVYYSYSRLSDFL